MMLNGERGLLFQWRCHFDIDLLAHPPFFDAVSNRRGRVEPNEGERQTKSLDVYCVYICRFVSIPTGLE